MGGDSPFEEEGEGEKKAKLGRALSLQIFLNFRLDLCRRGFWFFRFAIRILTY